MWKTCRNASCPRWEIDEMGFQFRWSLAARPGIGDETDIRKTSQSRFICWWFLWHSTSCWRYPSSLERYHVMWVLHLTSNLRYNYVSRKEILVSNTHNLPNKSSSSSSSSLRNIDDRCNGREIDSLLTEARYTQACNHPLHWGLIYTWYGLRYLLIFTLSLQSPHSTLVRTGLASRVSKKWSPLFCLQFTNHTWVYSLSEVKNWFLQCVR